MNPFLSVSTRELDRLKQELNNHTVPSSTFEAVWLHGEEAHSHPVEQDRQYIQMVFLVDPSLNHLLNPLVFGLKAGGAATSLHRERVRAAPKMVTKAEQHILKWIKAGLLDLTQLVEGQTAWKTIDIGRATAIFRTVFDYYPVLMADRMFPFTKGQVSWMTIFSDSHAEFGSFFAEMFVCAC